MEHSGELAALLGGFEFIFCGAPSPYFTCPAVPRSELCSTTGVVKFIRKFLLLGYSKMGFLKN